MRLPYKHIFISGALLVTLLLLNLKTGYIDYSWSYIFQHLDSDLILKLRAESAWAAVLAGSGLSLAGLSLQTIFRNPLAGPSVLGISSFSGLAVALFFFIHQFLFAHSFYFSKLQLNGLILLFSLLGAFVSLLLLWFFKKKQQFLSGLLIIGMMIAAFCNGIIYLIESILQRDNLQSLTLWNLGSFRQLDLQQLLLLSMILLGCTIFITAHAKHYNTYLLGDTYAEGLGLPVKNFLMLHLMITAVITASITAFCGPIGFIGLAVPHLVKYYFKTHNHRFLIPITLLTGANIALICHWITSLQFFGTNIPINAVTSLIGAPFTIWLIFKLNNQYA